MSIPTEQQKFKLQNLKSYKAIFARNEYELGQYDISDYDDQYWQLTKKGTFKGYYKIKNVKNGKVIFSRDDKLGVYDDKEDYKMN
jgi:hypothetical protein